MRQLGCCECACHLQKALPPHACCAWSAQDQPTFVSLFAYFGFWALVALDVIIKWRRGMLFDAMAKMKRREAKAAARAARKQVSHIYDVTWHGNYCLKPN